MVEFATIDNQVNNGSTESETQQEFSTIQAKDRVNYPIVSFMEINAGPGKWEMAGKVSRDSDAVHRIRQVKFGRNKEENKEITKKQGAFIYEICLPKNRVIQDKDGTFRILVSDDIRVEEPGDVRANGSKVGGETARLVGTNKLLGGERGPTYLTAWMNDERGEDGKPTGKKVGSITGNRLKGQRSSKKEEAKDDMNFGTSE